MAVQNLDKFISFTKQGMNQYKAFKEAHELAMVAKSLIDDISSLKIQKTNAEIEKADAEKKAAEAREKVLSDWQERNDNAQSAHDHLLEDHKKEISNLEAKKKRLKASISKLETQEKEQDELLSQTIRTKGEEVERLNAELASLRSRLSQFVHTAEEVKEQADG